MTALLIVAGCGVAALAFAFIKSNWITAQDGGTDKMKEIGGHIAEGAMAFLRATLTLPGVAGIILTVGMAVDANILIYERIREELRGSKSVRAAIATGFQKATGAVLDANITTLITAIILYQYGTGPIKGFGLTLTVGIVVSMFTARARMASKRSKISSRSSCSSSSASPVSRRISSMRNTAASARWRSASAT